MLHKNRLVCLIIAVLVGVLTFCLILFIFLLQIKGKDLKSGEKLALVMDAGSTSTRSTLLRISVDENWIVSSSKNTNQKQLNQLIRIQPILRCKNGKAVTKLNSSEEAEKLIQNCLPEYVYRGHIEQMSSNHTKQIEDVNSIEQDYAISTNNLGILEDNKSYHDKSNKSHENYTNNPMILMYLGATAGMRSLAIFEPQIVEEKFHWLRESANKISKMQANDLLHLTEDSFQILTGFQEAAYSWLSVNYFCSKLNLDAKFNGTNNSREIKTIASLELGGSSAQITYEKYNTSSLNNKYSYSLNIFNNSIAKSLYARSDPCLGIVQASLRAQILNIRNFLNIIPEYLYDNSTRLDIQLDCWYSGWYKSMTTIELKQLSALPCMRIPKNNYSLGFDPIITFIEKNEHIQMIHLIGNLNQNRCNAIIGNLFNRTFCNENFHLCLSEPLNGDLPLDTPFVGLSVLSDFAHALKLNHENQTSMLKSSNESHSIQDGKLDDELNSYSIDYMRTKEKLSELCNTKIDAIQDGFNIKTKYLATACFDYNYMFQLMTNYYGFDQMNGRWNQLKFRNSLNVINYANKNNSKDLSCRQGLALDWTVGLVLSHISDMLNGDEQRLFQRGWNTPTRFIITSFDIVYYVIIILFGVLVYVSATLMKWFLFHSRSNSNDGEEISID